MRYGKRKSSMWLDELVVCLGLELAASVVEINKLTCYWSQSEFVRSHFFKNLMFCAEFFSIRSAPTFTYNMILRLH